MLKLYTQDKEFNYEQPEMIYDKATGDVKIIEKKKGLKKKLIRNMDDLEKEKEMLFKEVGLGSTDVEEMDAATES